MENDSVPSIKLDMNSIQEDDIKRCLLKVYLEYPEELHNLHNDFPLPLETIEIKKYAIKLLQ